MLQWRDSSGKTDASRPRSAARRLDRSSAESEAMEAASRLQLIAASCSAIPIYVPCNEVTIPMIAESTKKQNTIARVSGILRPSPGCFSCEK
ncbi:hypothetical protein [Salicibibacter cibi]|uniref:hypothetical protein n=1 Tax=Salicibibacter cibi TaxID=2743001 RepID=UPI001B7D86AE|nr:hypothetical protein [Salicibibacter cibi]